MREQKKKHCALTLLWGDFRESIQKQIEIVPRAIIYIWIPIRVYKFMKLSDVLLLHFSREWQESCVSCRETLDFLATRIYAMFLLKMRIE